MITVHYLEHSRAHRILWLLEELGLSYEVKTYKRGADMHAPAALKAVHPLGKSPVIEDDGRIFAESGAIIEYLIDTYGADTNGKTILRPAPGSDAFLRYRYWLHYAEGSAMPLLVMKLVFSRLSRQMPFLLRGLAKRISDGVCGKMIDPQIGEHLAFWQAELRKDGYFAGPDFTAADIAMSFPVESVLSISGDTGDVTILRSYLSTIRARPAYQRALQRGGAYMFAKT
ncbi:glutathione S-transferase [Agrobacterium vitis]|uniref:glutathione S-transferase family protein n=1 Tax=Agrobacterium vitis TaxID=373 RepID=UPI00087224FB|nr:glutathione S-transferase [Agrobacterium vitis]MCE6073875.1 glutathione S-transferase [Agrobacterium vitis]MCM2453308.1 glutathione S-transferase [Agrobacterium vitis]MCM2468706.1 glutathione S-transferase [Agrobacterium vitis]MUO71578.1 glutathione S-transferase [Agrobacterium vitis]MUO86031.1 glutathione S-transferase [Agrobacterium vitis]